MRRAIVLAAAALLVLAATSAPARAAMIHATAGLAGTQTTLNATPFVPVNFYIVADGFDGVPSALAGFEFSVSTLPSNFLVLDRQLPAGSVRIGSDDDFMVGLAVPLPTTPEPVLLCTYTVMLTSPVSDVLVTLGPIFLSSFHPPVPGYTENNPPMYPLHPFSFASSLLINQVRLPTPNFPEPATLSLLAVGCAVVMRRKRSV